MILIGESGATKADWRLIGKDGNIQQFQQKGFNMATHDSAEFLEGLKPLIAEPEKVTKVYLYAAGVSEGLKKPLIKSMNGLFPDAVISVETDLLAAARGIFGTEAGMVGILGTGANLCEYNGDKITGRIPPLGYILGDEGGGSYMGRKMLARYLRGQFSDELLAEISTYFNGIEEEEVIREVYGKPSNTYLASFSRFLIENQNDREIYQLIHRCFHDYFDAFEATTDLRYGFTGSVAFLCGNILRKVAAERRIMLDLIVQSPIAGLTLYHQENG
ncbi:MAG: N-acetylglucosamine kinase [Cyclobacteriaceae bacterium]|nr:N-acetylglucosamine kinase [Cyclobacteriaceae bacterium SS2]